MNETVRGGKRYPELLVALHDIGFAETHNIGVATTSQERNLHFIYNNIKPKIAETMITL